MKVRFLLCLQYADATVNSQIYPSIPGVHKLRFPNRTHPTQPPELKNQMFSFCFYNGFQIQGL